VFSVGVVACVSALSAGGCYRAEIDLSPLTDTLAGTANGGTGAPPSGSGSGGGGAAESGGSAEMPEHTDTVVRNGPLIGRGGAGGESFDLPDSASGACEELVFSADDTTCHITKKPTPAMCSQDPEGWAGCYDGGCTVCTLNHLVPGYPHYFDWHPCCSPNDTCSTHDPVKCDARCPKPTDHDRVAPCGKSNPNPG